MPEQLKLLFDEIYNTGWGFDAVLDLIGSDFHVASPTLTATSQSTVPPKDDTRKRSPRLGDFSKLFDELGISEPLIPPSPVDFEGLISFDEATCLQQDNRPPSERSGESTLNGVLSKQSGSTSSEERPDPTSSLAELTSKQQKQARKKAAQKARNARNTSETLDISTIDIQQAIQPRPQSNVGLKIRPATPLPLELPSDTLKHQQATKINKVSPVPAVIVPVKDSTLQLNSLAPPFTPSRHVEHDPFSSANHNADISSRGLIPRTVQPVTHLRRHDAKAVPFTHAYRTMPLYASSQPAPPPQHPMAIAWQRPLVTPVVQIPITPARGLGQLTLRPQTARHFHFMNHLLANFPTDVKWLVAPMQLFNEKTATTQGIHCFVDASNIMIGFKDILRRVGYSQFEMSFDSLALLMERRRPVAKRIYAGSHREAAPLPHVTKLVETSKAVGYENLVKEQVFIRREDSERKKFFKDVEKMGWYKATQRRSGNSSGSDSETGHTITPSTPPSAPKWVEQGVDEILHLKMCQSIIDTDVPTTMVLATGDGNVAEFSDGFLANVERALKKGWAVELLSWRQQTSSGYRNKKFRAKWGDRFRIIELDDYLESLIDTP
ncbi:hypothetical protein N0V90_002171 [Kalmusia sp. IMI 367209]|nr:hypothetical protein N0V90_002171 [Kalmusia sp. IMI 367209]